MTSMLVDPSTLLAVATLALSHSKRKEGHSSHCGLWNAHADWGDGMFGKPDDSVDIEHDKNMKICFNLSQTLGKNLFPGWNQLSNSLKS